MPKKTFYNLPKEKKERLLEAAFKEFSNEPIEEVSINAIIQNSDISRGSFYQYFEDKEDLYCYCLDLLRENQFVQIENCFKNANGNVITGLFDTFDYFYHHFFKSNHKNFYHQFFLNTTYRTSRDFYKQGEEKDPLGLFERIAENMEDNDSNFETKSEAVEFLQFFFQMMHGTISQVFSQNLSEKEAYELMKKRLMWMANGISKEKIKKLEDISI